MEEGSRAKQLREVVEAALRNFVEMTNSSGISKLTVADFIRLMQFQQDAWSEKPKEIRVTWVETPTTGSDSVN